MSRGIQRSFQLFCALVFFFGVVGVSEASWEGTIGTRFTVNGSGFGIKKPSVYVEYEKKPRIITKVAVKVESYSDTSLTCLWTAKLPVGTYNLFVKPQVKGSTPVYIDTFSLTNPSINNITPAAGSVGDIITIQGKFFSSKKPKIYLEDRTTLKRKACKVLSFWMDPLTGESSLQFVVPKTALGDYEHYDLILKNQIAEVKEQKKVIGTKLETITVTLPISQPLSLKTVAMEGSTINSDGTSRIEVPEGFYSFIYVTDQNDNIVGMSYSLADGKDITVNVNTTALAVVLSLPIDWAKYHLSIEEVFAKIQPSSWYPLLLQQVENIITIDPSKLISEQHPEIWETTIKIVKEIVGSVLIQNKAQKDVKASSMEFLSPAYIEDIAGPSILIKNKHSVPYGISSVEVDTGHFQPYSFFNKRPWWVPGKTWLDHYLSIFFDDISVEYKLSAGNFTTCVGKFPAASMSGHMKDIIEDAMGSEGYSYFSDVMAGFENRPLPVLDTIMIDAQLKGTVAWVASGAFIAIGFVPGWGDAVSLGGEVFLEFANTGEIGLFTIPKGIIKSAAEGKASTGIQIFAENLRYLADTAQNTPSNVRIMAKIMFGGSQKIAGMATGARKLAKILDIVGNLAIVGDIADAMLFVTATEYAEDVACYDISQDSSGKATVRRHLIETIPPSVPTGLTATAVSSSSISLTWNASIDTGGAGVAGYNIYRDGNLINGSAVTNYSDTSLAPNTRYCYTVSAYDASSNFSVQSASICATTFSGISNAPDLLITSLSAPTIGAIGDQISMSLDIINQGYINAAPFRVGFYFSTDSYIDIFDTFSGWGCDIAGLYAGFADNCSGSLGIPSFLTPGLYYFGAIADDLSQISETNEGNNVRIADTGLINLTTGSPPGTIDVSGCWTLYMTDGIESNTFYVDLVQSGNTLSGTMTMTTDQSVQLQLSGSINGSTITFVAVEAISFTGSVNGDTFSGTWANTSLQKSGTWSAQRRTCGVDPEPPTPPVCPLDKWNVRNSGTTENLAEVVYGGGLFVACSNKTVLSSTDGITWVKRNINLETSNYYIKDIAYGNGLFVAAVLLYENRLMILTSSNGITWNKRITDIPFGGSNVSGIRISYGNGLFIVLSNYVLLTSADGINWSQKVLNLYPLFYNDLIGTINFQSVTYGNGLFVAVASSLNGGSFIFTSDDGIYWIKRHSLGFDILRGITYGNGLFVAVSEERDFGDYTYHTSGAIFTSSDTIYWDWSGLRYGCTSRCGFTDVTYGNGLFVASTDFAMIAFSSSGNKEAWTRINLDQYTGWSAITSGNGTFILVGQHGLILQSDCY